MAYEFDTATQDERQAHCAQGYCIRIMEDRARHERLKGMQACRGERYRAARNIGSWMKLVAGLANSIIARAGEQS